MCIQKHRSTTEQMYRFEGGLSSLSGMECLGYSFGTRADVEFCVDVVKVEANGMNTEEEFVSDDFVTMAFNKKIEHLNFASRES